MEYDKKYRIEKVVSKDITRESILHLNAQKLEGKDVLVATNGKTLAVIPIKKGANDKLGLVSVDAVKTARKQGGKYAPVSICLKKEEQRLAYDIVIPRPEPVRYPNVAQVIPTEKPNFRLGINVKLLADLAQSIGVDEVILETKIEDDSTILSPWTVTPYWQRDQQGAFGVIMPMRTESIKKEKK